jgi:hypothetical protein
VHPYASWRAHDRWESSCLAGRQLDRPEHCGQRLRDDVEGDSGGSLAVAGRWGWTGPSSQGDRVSARHSDEGVLLMNS